MARLLASIALTIAAMFLFSGNAHAEEQCRLLSRYSDSPPTPTHVVSFVFTGVEGELVVLAVDELPVFEARLTTQDWSTEFSGATRCLMSGRYWINVKIGETEGNLRLDVSEETTIYLSGRRGVLSFNVWGPDAPGLD